MSLYCFGKAKSPRPDPAVRSQLAQLAVSSGVGMFFEIDPEDAMFLHTASGLEGPGVHFTVSDSLDRGEAATGAWIDVMTVARRELSHERPIRPHTAWETEVSDSYLRAVASTPLGRFCDGLFHHSSLTTVGIALVDGCIDCVVWGGPGSCAALSAKAFACDWHDSPNALYVCERERSETEIVKFED